MVETSSFLQAVQRGASGAAPWAEALVASVWSGLLLVIAVWCALRVLPGMAARLRAAIWTGVLVTALGLAFAPFVGHAVHGGPVPEQGAAPAAHAWVLGAGWALVLLFAWTSLSVWRLACLGWSVGRLWRLVAAAEPVRAEGRIAEALGRSSRKVELCVAPGVRRPCVAGFWQPRILLPAGLVESLQERELEALVLHELEHLERRDDWGNLLAKVALAMFPLNPALFWVERRLAAERELACDDAVLRQTGARKAYAACLVGLAERDSMLGRGASLALGAWDRRSELLRRVERIVAAPEPVMGRAGMRLASAVIAVGVIGGSVLLGDAPDPVRFVSSAPRAVARTIPVETTSMSAPRMVRTSFVEAPVRSVALEGRQSHVSQAPFVVQTVSHAEGVPLTSTGLSRVRAVLTSSKGADMRRHVSHKAPENDLSISPASRNALVMLLKAVQQARADGQFGVASILERQMLEVLAMERTDTAARAEAVARPVEFSSSFAAVPTLDGWWIVQL